MEETQITKKDSGWTAVTTFDMPKARAELRVETFKSHTGALKTVTLIRWCNGIFRTHAAGLRSGTGDFSVDLASYQGKRATETAIRVQHHGAVSDLQRAVEQARDHYQGQIDNNDTHTARDDHLGKPELIEDLNSLLKELA